MAELEKVRRVITKQMPDAPHETLMTVDATTGQNGVRQAKLFGEAVGVTGIVLTKLDGTAKGGIALAIANELGIPVKLIGIGEQLEDLRPFDADEFSRALLHVSRAPRRSAPWAKTRDERRSMNASSAPIVRAVGLQHEHGRAVRRRRASPRAGRPFARVGLIRMRRVTPPGQACGDPHDLRDPCTPRPGGILSTASSRSSATSASTSARSQRRRSASSSSRSAAAAARGRERRELALDRRPRALERAVHARRRRLEQLGDLGRVQPSTSRRISTARWRPGRDWIAVRERELHPLALRVARRRVDTGEAVCSTRASGYGCTGAGRRGRRSSSSRQALVAIR